MKRSGKKILLGLLLALPAMAPFALADSFSGATNNIIPGLVNSGGQGGVSSASNNLIGDVGEIGLSTYTSTNYILEPGFGSLNASAVALPRRANAIDAQARLRPGRNEALRPRRL